MLIFWSSPEQAHFHVYFTVHKHLSLYQASGGDKYHALSIALSLLRMDARNSSPYIQFMPSTGAERREVDATVLRVHVWVSAGAGVVRTCGGHGRRVGK